MGAEEQQQELLGALEAPSDSAGNGPLRELLGWDEASHDAAKDGGSRFRIDRNGSPLFTGSAGPGKSEIPSLCTGK